MSDQRNMIIAIALSVLVLVGFQYFSEQLIPGRQATTPGQQTAPAEGGSAPVTGAEGEGEALRIPGQATSSGSAPAAPTVAVELAKRDAALGKVRRAPISNPRLEGTVPGEPVAERKGHGGE